MKRTVKIIVNPIAGRGKARSAMPKLRRGLRALGFTVDTTITRRSGEARQAAAEADGAVAIVTVGGDGTINEVLNGLGDQKIPLAVFPSGTGNILSKELGLPRTPEGLLDAIREHRTRWFDLLELESARAPSGGAPPREPLRRRFLSVLGAGFDAEIVRKLSAARKGAIHIAFYTIPILKALQSYRFPPIRIEMDGKVISRRVGFAVIANVASFGGPFKFALEALPDDGLLDVIVFRRRTRTDFIRYAAGVLTRSHMKFPDVRSFRGREVRLTSRVPRVPVQVDGDSAGFLPATVRVLPRALQVMVPPSKTRGTR